MSHASRRPVIPVVSAGHARLPDLTGLRRACVVTLIALVIQFSLGMILNLYVPVPSSDQHAGVLQEIRTAPFALTTHVLLGLLLIGAAVVLVKRAIGIRDRAMIALAASGLGGVLGAFAAGEVFVRNGASSASLAMTILTGIALVSYIGALGRVGAALQQTMRPPLYPPPRPAGGPQPRTISPASGSRPRLDYQRPPQPHPAYSATGPQPRRPTGPQPRAPHQTGPQPRAGYPRPAGWALPPLTSPPYRPAARPLAFPDRGQDVPGMRPGER